MSVKRPVQAANLNDGTIAVWGDETMKPERNLELIKRLSALYWAITGARPPILSNQDLRDELERR